MKNIKKTLAKILVKRICQKCINIQEHCVKIIFLELSVEEVLDHYLKRH